VTVSIDTNPSPPSSVDPDWRAAFEGGDNFISRSQHLSQLKAQADAALAELKLATSAKEAFDNATAALGDAERKQAEATALFEQANTVLKKAESDAADTVKAAQADAATLLAEAQKARDEAADAKTSVERALAEANAKCRQLESERQAASRLGEQAEQTRADFKRKADLLHAYLATAQAELAELSAPAPAGPAMVQLAS
jgi:chromosome segregation ATPase